VTGSSKAAALQAALEADEDVRRYPAQLLRRVTDRVEWIVDRAAAALLRRTG
jgi:6-phosphogluconolactonase/glucosamine-6-phosphate isomerase/deaminase